MTETSALDRLKAEVRVQESKEDLTLQTRIAEIRRQAKAMQPLTDFLNEIKGLKIKGGKQAQSVIRMHTLAHPVPMEHVTGQINQIIISAANSSRYLSSLQEDTFFMIAGDSIQVSKDRDKKQVTPDQAISHVVKLLRQHKIELPEEDDGTN